MMLKCASCGWTGDDVASERDASHRGAHHLADWCRECGADEAVIQIATMAAETRALCEAFREWCEAFNRWTEASSQAREMTEAANRAVLPILMAAREQLGIDGDDPREVDP